MLLGCQADEALTALRFDDSGLQCAVGTSNGLVALFDLRASRPTFVKDHMYGAPIKDIKFHTIDSMAGALLALHRSHATCCGDCCSLHFWALYEACAWLQWRACEKSVGGTLIGSIPSVG